MSAARRLGLHVTLFQPCCCFLHLCEGWQGALQSFLCGAGGDGRVYAHGQSKHPHTMLGYEWCRRTEPFYQLGDTVKGEGDVT